MVDNKIVDMYDVIYEILRGLDQPNINRLISFMLSSTLLS